MRCFKADLHIHTVLSPCGELEMTPAQIVRWAKQCGLDLIGITDHNSTRHCAEVRRIGGREGVAVLCGAEITTAEEAHCLAFVEGDRNLAMLQEFLDERLPDVANDPELFGWQVAVDEQERVVWQEDRLLISALNASLEEVEAFVHSLGGIFIPAHLDKTANSLLSQLGFVPPGLRAEAMEISPRTGREDFLKCNPALACYPIVSFSDAHMPDQIGRRSTTFHMESPTFDEVLAALRGLDGRSVEITPDR